MDLMMVYVTETCRPFKKNLHLGTVAISNVQFVVLTVVYISLTKARV